MDNRLQELKRKAAMGDEAARQAYEREQARAGIITQEALWVWMMDGNYPEGYPLRAKKLHRMALATLSQDIKSYASKGTRVKVTMASRMGDVGITTKLGADRGYDARIRCVEAMFGERLLSPEYLLEDIELIPDESENQSRP